jgi:hypothetical protein
MKRPFALAALGLALAVAAPLATSGTAWSQDGAAAVVGKPAPEIQVGDWINGDGRSTLADFRGEVVMLEFWGTH